MRPIIKPLEDNKWEMVEDFIYVVTGNEVIYIPKGFIFDFASVPSIFWGFPFFMPPVAGNYKVAALVHDYLYSIQSLLRSESDSLFLRICKDYGVNNWKAYSMYCAVRVGGCKSWTRKSNRSIEFERKRQFISFQESEYSLKHVLYPSVFRSK